MLTPLKLNIAEKLNDKDYRKRFFRGQCQDMLAMNIRQLREKRSMTQKELAEIINTKQPRISQIEQGEYSGWSLRSLLKIANALDARLTITLESSEKVVGKYKNLEKWDLG